MSEGRPGVTVDDGTADARAFGPLRGRRIVASEDGRGFALDDGTPFFYLGDTAWTLFKRLTLEEACRYFDDRASKGFTVIQAYLLRGLQAPNRFGEVPLRGYDPTKLNERFFENVDALVNAANERGLVIAMVTTFGEHVRGGTLLAAQGRRSEVIFDEDNAYRFGRLIGERYAGSCVMWLLGGDRSPIRDLRVWNRMGEGLKAGCPEALVSFHGPGGTSSSYWFHWAKWLDFNTIQSGHARDVPNYVFVWHDRAIAPPKPTLDMEPRYENHPDGNDSAAKVMDGLQQRSAGYWAVLGGAAGHGYGANDIWQFAGAPGSPDGREEYAFPRLAPTVGWEDALEFDGAWGMCWMRRLAERYQWHRWKPIADGKVSVDGRDDVHVAVATDADSGVALMYLPPARKAEVDLQVLGMSSARIAWYNPRNGTETDGEVLSGVGKHVVEMPYCEVAEDWVLVLRGRQ